MSRHQIVTVGHSAAVLLPEDILNRIDVHIGDEVDVSIVGHTLMVRSLDEVERHQQLETVLEDVFERRKSAYQQLAEGEA
jgi:antitoxin component of MazEF toxin-antitoxin module